MNAYIKLFSLSFCCLFAFALNAQVVPQGFNYQGVLRTDNGDPQSNQIRLVYIGLLENSSSGNLAYEETHSVTTNEDGWFNVVIGQGMVTPNGTLDDFSNIDWGANLFYVQVSVDFLDGLGPITLGTEQLFSVPYALYSRSTEQTYGIEDMTDVDLTGLANGDILSWNGNNWEATSLTNAIDSVAFAYNANQSVYADTAQFANSVLFCDSASFATTAGTTLFANTATNSTYADTATFATTALSAINAWNLTGNTIDDNQHFIGTTNNADLIFKTNDTERMRITKTGTVGIGTSTPSANLHIRGNDGLLLEGEQGVGAIPTSGEGSRLMWYSGKSALRAGYVSDDHWDDANIGQYSYAGGNDCIASGDYSFTHGDQCEASGDASAAFGYQAKSDGYASFAVGPQSEAYGFASVAMGRKCKAIDTASIALGYQNRSEGIAAVAFGYQSESIADYSTAMGFRAKAIHQGSFIWQSTGNAQGEAYTTAENQFMAIANGGIEFYSSLDLSTGVVLEAGGGAWNTVSDRFKKENFETVNGTTVLDKIRGIEVSNWNYKTQDKSIRHIGPMAQDFYAAFGLGSSDKTITTTDIDGVNLAALKALTEKTDELTKKTAALEKISKDYDQLKAEKEALQQRLEKLEKMVTDLEK